MKVLGCSVENFASYRELTFNFSNQGLTLVRGATGSGKSTLCDIIPWILFGVTAKNGSVAEVISWPGDRVTFGSITIDTARGPICIERRRGTTKDNDLWYFLKSDISQRGKDINDTQQQINSFLGVTPELYLAGAYFHEFSQTAQFFSTSAKIRRSIIDQIVDMALHIKLTNSLKEFKTAQKIVLEKKNNDKDKIAAKLEVLKEAFQRESKLAAAWKTEAKLKIKNMEFKKAAFIQGQNKIVQDITKEHAVISMTLAAEIDMLTETLVPEQIFDKRQQILDVRKASCKEDVCLKCGSKLDDHERLVITKDTYQLIRDIETNEKTKNQIKTIHQRLDTYASSLPTKLNVEKAKVNPYYEMLKLAQMEVNTHEETKKALKNDIQNYESQIENLTVIITSLALQLMDAQTLTEILDIFKKTITNNAVSALESKTNSLLSDFFDGEISVKFQVTATDKLEVNISKDGNECSYTQLSKGQRQMLRLCFGVSMMEAVSNYQGVSFNALFFDEATDGMDDSNKMKAFKLLEHVSLKHESVFLVEHASEVKTMATSSYLVTLIDGKSQIAKTQ
jgi:DNA repair exonuclease SbcCD ATPase subunit